MIMIRNRQADMETYNRRCYNMDSYFLIRKKMKRPSNDDDYKIVLDFTIHHAEDVDNPSTHPSVAASDRNYAVTSWVEPDKEFRTHIVSAQRNPEWKRNFRMLWNPSMSCRFLNVEVLRLHSTCDPGTSSGTVVVGRVRIPIPSQIDVKYTGRYGLVRLVDAGCKAEGHIIVSLELKQLRRH